MNNIKSKNDDKNQSSENDLTRLVKFCKNGFDNNLTDAALVLGKTPEDLKDILEGRVVLDEDLQMKIQGVARERNIEI